MTEEKRRGYNILISEQEVSPSAESFAPEAIAPEMAPEMAPETAKVKSDKTEVLSINGKPIPFTKNDEGYHIYYLPPAPTLIEAARNYVDIQREIVE